MNLNGGTLATTSIQGGGGSGTLDLNGGTIKALGSSGNFIGNNGAGTLSTYVYGGGVTIDTNGNNPTITTTLQAQLEWALPRRDSPPAAQVLFARP